MVTGSESLTDDEHRARRPAGRVAVTEALKVATLKLLVDKGQTFSVREAAE